ncbi:MAG: hypothetical protein GY898_16550 [Proteobacteria bacterium]|nr:hypothetical protein [Pseudomonadota bacterium]
MPRRSIQLNIRATQDVVDAFRDEAQKRNLSLGDALAALLTLSQAGRSRGVWLTLPADGEAALRAVSAARRVEPGAVLAELIGGNLRRELLTLASRLGDPDGEPTLPPGAPPTQDEDEVGIFTVFD